ncbi:hypothetical protein PR202_ga24447 [Eleusine coracana subsp. coracana]|uniref:Serpin domain-containing protein n=1 Tax=Eleusine coracana subsp. coracana TaxID=191504 RepID=A0AAV5D8E4_ELECO|nr:hypothetical protein PR202_ga24447 [Eleusine coracana subsp. coracana]
MAASRGRASGRRSVSVCSDERVEASRRGNARGQAVRWATGTVAGDGVVAGDGGVGGAMAGDGAVAGDDAVVGIGGAGGVWRATAAGGTGEREGGCVRWRERSELDWQEDTLHYEFHLLDGSSIEVPFLRSWNDQYIACHDGFKVLKLPYQIMEEDLYCSEPKFSMCVFLPGERKGLTDLDEKIASSPEFLTNHIPTKSVPVGQFRLPKFKLTFEKNIVSDLKSLGLRLPFGTEAEMTNMLLDQNVEGLFVSTVVHKAVIEMNEEGSEAVAVTAESDDDMRFSFFEYEPPKPRPVVNFVADHPFAFFIVDETSGAIVFAGHVLDPSKEE